MRWVYNFNTRKVRRIESGKPLGADILVTVLRIDIAPARIVGAIKKIADHVQKSPGHLGKGPVVGG